MFYLPLSYNIWVKEDETDRQMDRQIFGFYICEELGYYNLCYMVMKLSLLQLSGLVVSTPASYLEGPGLTFN
jgi:hypothetical protein